MSESLKSLLEKVCTIYQEELEYSREAKDYLKSRGLTEGTIKRFRLGYSPYTNAVIDEEIVMVPPKYFIQKLFAEAPLEQWQETGLVKQLSGDHEIFTPSNYIMIPAFDIGEEIIAFIERFVGEVECFRYRDTFNMKNAPKREEIFYEANFAQDAVHQTGEVYVFEGSFDVMLAHQ